MRQLVQEMIQSGQAGNYYAALAVALMIPDICGALSSQNGAASKKNYVKWFNKYMDPDYQNHLNGDDCYYYRCSFLHQGSSQHPQNRNTRILFHVPDPWDMHFGNLPGGELVIEINQFCIDIMNGVDKWLSEVETTDLYKKNCEKFIHIYAAGEYPGLNLPGMIFIG